MQRNSDKDSVHPSEEDAMLNAALYASLCTAKQAVALIATLQSDRAIGVPVIQQGKPTLPPKSSAKPADNAQKQSITTKLKKTIWRCGVAFKDTPIGPLLKKGYLFLKKIRQKNK